MKTAHILLAAVLAATSAIQAATAEHKLPAPLPEFKTPEQLVVWRKEMAEKAAAADAQAAKQTNSTSISHSTLAEGTSVFYTGKPFLQETGSYAFKFRQYNPELNRWTSADPSGFPDGSNNGAYLPTPTSELDWQGLLTVNTSSGQPGHWVHGNGLLDMAGLWYDATTTQGNTINVFKFSYIASNSTGLQSSQLDTSSNCHGYVFLAGYWIDNAYVTTILNDEWTPTDAAHALIVEYSGNQHTANNPIHDLYGNITSVTGKDGYMPVVTTALNETGYSSPAFWE